MEFIWSALSIAIFMLKNVANPTIKLIICESKWLDWILEILELLLRDCMYGEG